MATDDLKVEVTCSICTEIFTDPVTLKCGHSFCQVCITRTFDNKHDRECFCPECMQEFGKRPELKKNQRLSNIAKFLYSAEPKRDKPEHVCSYCVEFDVPAVILCLHCEAFLCDVHQQEHSKSPEHVLTDPTTSLEDRKCPVHKKILEYYCIDDGTCICAHCMTTDHNGHKVNTISEFLQQQIKNLNPILEKLSSKKIETEAMLQSLQNHKRKIDKEADGVVGKVNAIMKDIRIKQEDLEMKVLTEVSKRQKQISLSVSNDIQQLEYEKSEREKKITQIEELSRNTNPISALQTAELLLCVSMDECNLDAGMGREIIHKAGDLNEHVILETLHSGLSNIVVGAGKDVHMKDVLKVSLSSADDNIHIGSSSSSVSNEPQIQVPIFIHEPNAPVQSYTPSKTQTRAITTKPQNVLLITAESQNNPLVAAEPPKVTPDEAEPQNSQLIAAEPQNIQLIADEPQNIQLIAAEPQNIQLIAAEPQNVLLITAESQNNPLVAAEPPKVTPVEAESQNIQLIEAEPQNILFIAAEPQNIQLIAAEPRIVPLIAVEPQNIPLFEAKSQNIPLILGNRLTTQEMLPGVNKASNCLLNYDAIDNDMDNDVDNDIDNDIDKDIDKDIDNDVNNDVDNDVDNDIDNDIDYDIDNDVDNDIDNDMDNNVDNDVDNDIDNDIDYDIDKDIDNDVNNDVDNDIDNDIDYDIDKDIDNDVNNDVDIDVDNDIDNDIDYDIDNNIDYDID
ncbi:uncharacterized protein LOC143933539 [Lithobates pipiens]